MGRKVIGVFENSHTGGLSLIDPKGVLANHSSVNTQLNPAQQTVVSTIAGPLLVIAGPGAGKTKTLVERVLHLLVDLKVPPEAVFIATFTEKAAKELVTRISNRAIELGVEVNFSALYLGTLHSLFLRILEEFRSHTELKRNYRLLDDFEQKYLVYRKLSDYQKTEGYELLVPPRTSRWDQAERLCELVSQAGEEALEIPLLLASSSPTLSALGRLLEAFHGQLTQENALDFATIQTSLWTLLQVHPDVLETLRGRFQYFMIDEYQDTSTIQEKILLRLSSPRNNLCVVGDDDQGLYRFRGATIRNILEFPANFGPKECRVVEMVTNYRSHPGIVDFYNRWMGQIPSTASWVADDGTRFRYEKVIQPRQADFGEYSSVVRVAGSESQESWHQEVLDFLATMKDRGLMKDHNQVAFLFKSVKSEKVIGLARDLEDAGVPVFSPRSALFFQRQEVRLMVGAFVFLFPELIDTHLKWNADAHLDEWQYYRESLDLFATELRSDPVAHKGLRVWCAQKAMVHRQLTQATDYAFSQLFYELLQFPLFADFVEINLTNGVQDQRPIYNLALFSRLLTQFEFLHHIIVLTPQSLSKDLRGLFNEYLRFLIDGGIAEYEDFDATAPSGCVSFLTIHQSKGLEFPIVFVGSLNSVPRKGDEGLDRLLVEHYLGRTSFEPQERIKFFDFWRLYYTAFSRPQNLLVLTGAEEREGRGMARLPSLYFKGLWDSVLSWRDGGLELPEFSLADVIPPHLKHEYAFTSHIAVYENCPLQYKWFRELEFSPVRTNAALFGTLVHQTIEDAHKAVLAGHPEHVTDQQVKTWLSANYASLSRATRTYLAPGTLNAVEGHVRRYLDQARSEWSSLREAEVSVSLVEPRYILKGTVDLVRGKDDTVEILDFKTEKKPDVNHPQDREKLNRYRRQLQIYAHILEGRTGHKVSRMHLYYTGAGDENPYISYDNDRAQVNRTIASLDDVVAKIESKDFDHSQVTKTQKQCGSCDIKPFCWRDA